MRKSIFVAVIPALFVAGALQAQAPQPQSSPSQPSTAPASEPAAPSQSQAPVGTPPSNVDEKATSGSYYPYSAGTAGDDPAKPTATTVMPDGDGPAARAASPSEQWMTADADQDTYLSKGEFEHAWPQLGARFDEIDVNHDKKLTRDELRVWQTSQKARMDADEPARTPTTGIEPAAAPAAPTTPTAPTAPAAPTPPNR